MEWKLLSVELPDRNDTCWVTDGKIRALASWDTEAQQFEILVLYNVTIKPDSLTHWAYAVDLPNNTNGRHIRIRSTVDGADIINWRAPAHELQAKYYACKRDKDLLEQKLNKLMEMINEL
jgi:hypothetical protein